MPLKNVFGQGEGRKMDENGQKLEENGQKIDENGQKINENGQNFYENGQKTVTSEWLKRLFPAKNTK